MLKARTPFVLLAAVSLLVACSGDNGPTRPDPTDPLPPPQISCTQTVCSDISGDWTAAWSVPPCGTASASTAAVVTQTGCEAEIAISGLGTFSGCIEPVSEQSIFQVRFADGSPGSDDSTCNNAGTAGVVVEEDGTVTFPFGGGGEPECCRHGSVTLSR